MYVVVSLAIAASGRSRDGLLANQAARAVIGSVGLVLTRPRLRERESKQTIVIIALEALTRRQAPGLAAFGLVSSRRRL